MTTFFHDVNGEQQKWEEAPSPVASLISLDRNRIDLLPVTLDNGLKVFRWFLNGRSAEIDCTTIKAAMQIAQDKWGPGLRSLLVVDDS
jgi:hypothetical protein